MKNIPITLGFASITVVQLAAGIWMITLASENGGEVYVFVYKHCFDLERLLGLLLLHLCSPTRPATPL